MDFFCGSGTTLIAAQELNRKWIGIDKSEQAINIAKCKLNKYPNDFFINNNYSYLEEVNNENGIIEKIRNNKMCSNAG